MVEKMIKRILIASLILISISGCSMIPSRIQVDQTPIERPIIVIPTVDEFKAREVKWITITPENINNVFADLQEANEEIVLIATTPEGMQNLTLNMGDLLKLVQQQKLIIATYKEYYEKNQP